MVNAKTESIKVQIVFFILDIFPSVLSDCGTDGRKNKNPLKAFFFRAKSEQNFWIKNLNLYNKVKKMRFAIKLLIDKFFIV